MTRSTRGVARRRGLPGAALAMATLALAAGCSSGQITQTAEADPVAGGANRQVDLPDGRLLVRNAVLVYPGADGYPRGGTAPLELLIFNDTPAPVRLTGVTSPHGRVGLVQDGSPSPAASPQPAPTGGPVDVEIPARGFVRLAPGSGRYLQLAGLTESLLPGQSVTLTFQFTENAEIADVTVPLTTPLSPLPRSPMEFPDGEHG